MTSSSVMPSVSPHILVGPLVSASPRPERPSEAPDLFDPSAPPTRVLEGITILAVAGNLARHIAGIAGDLMIIPIVASRQGTVIPMVLPIICSVLDAVIREDVVIEEIISAVH